MAGHSHWAGIKHKKAMIDAKRGKLWSKLAKAIIVAAQIGGGDPNMNLRLRYAIDEAKAVSMPRDNIQRAIKRGTGELGVGQIEEVLYEGYGAGGIAIICEVLTDNRNRTAPEIRKIFERGGGKLGSTGCVAWMFERKGLILIQASATTEDALMEIALEAGADDIITEDVGFQIICEVTAFQDLRTAISEAGIEMETSQITRIPSTTVDIETVAEAKKILAIMEKLDDHDDIQAVSANFNIPDDIMTQVEADA